MERVGQGGFVLSGVCVSKKYLLSLFKENFENVNNLTLSKMYNKKAAMKYASKKETRIKISF